MRASSSAAGRAGGTAPAVVSTSAVPLAWIRCESCARVLREPRYRDFPPCVCGERRWRVLLEVEIARLFYHPWLLTDYDRIVLIQLRIRAD